VKKLMLFLLMGMFMISLSSAAGWDNKLTYSNNDMKFELENWFGFGESYGDVELKSHNSVHEVKKVSAGKDQTVMWYDFNFKELYTNGIGDIEFINMRTGEYVQRDYNLVYWGEEEINVYGMGECKNTLSNGTKTNCKEVVIATEIINTWLPYNSKDIPGNNITIGLQVDVKPFEITDVIWTIAGKKISKHAQFTGLGENSDVIQISTGGETIYLTNLTALTEGIITRVELGTADSSNLTTNTSIIQNGVTLATKLQSAWKFDDAPTVTFNLSDYTLNGVITPDVNNGIFTIKVEKTGGSGLMGTDSYAAFSGTLFNYSAQDMMGRHVSQPSVALFTFNQTVSPPVVLLNSPVDTFNSTSSTVVFNVSVNVSDTLTLINVSLFLDGVINETNTSGFTNTEYIFTKTFGDGNHNWSIIAYNNLSQNTTSATRIFSVDTTPGIIITVENPNATLDYGRLGFNETLNVTFTDFDLDTCWYDYNGTNITIPACSSAIKNSIPFILEDGNFNMTLYANDSFGTENNTFISWEYKVFEINRTFEDSVFETESQTFTINVSANSSLTAVGLVYDGDLRTTTLSNNFSTLAFDIPTSPGGKSLVWNFTYAGQVISSANSTQTVSSIQFDFCNATLTETYINFSFRNETTAEESITATISSLWNVWIGTGVVSKSFTLTNATENPNYDICFSPPNKTINTNVTLTYNNDISQQRAFTSEPILTNSTTQQVLYLLPSALGLFTQFQTRDVANNPIAAVKGIISRTLGSSTITSSSFFTDSSGLVIYFLNPDIVYTATFSKEGFINNIFTFVPTTDLRFVTMGTGVTINGSNISISTNYVITPTESSLVNNTLTTFGFNVTGNTGINFISMNITDGNGTSFGFTSNSGLGFISLIINTSDNKTITGIFEIRTSEENLTIPKLWIVGNEFEGDYSINKQGKLFLQYDFSDFIRLAMVIFIIFGIVIFMSGNEIADNNESKIAVVILMMWIFSSIEWLNNPAVVSNTGIAQFAKQYGIAILSTAGATFFFIRRIFV